MRSARPCVEIEPVVSHVVTLPRVPSEAPWQRVLLVLLLPGARQHERPVEVDGAGGRRGVFYYGGPELQPQ